MLRYIIRRVLVFVPTLFIISLLAFVISVNAPGDPVERLLNAADDQGGAAGNRSATEKLKQEKRSELGLDLPIFYFGLGTLADPDTLHKVPDKAHQTMLLRMARKTGNWPATADYFHSLNQAAEKTYLIIPDIGVSEADANQQNEAINRIKFGILGLMETSNETVIEARFDTLMSVASSLALTAPMVPSLQNGKAKYQIVMANKHKWRTYIPTIQWFGYRNQYHRWLFGTDGEGGVIRGDFGVSYQDQQPILTRIGERLQWSFWLTVLSVFLAYLISVPVGIYAAYKKNSVFDRASSVILFALYSLPNFFVGTLLLVLFANPDMLNWFPEGGVENAATFNQDWGFFAKLFHRAPYLVLPVIAYTYSSFAFISRQMRVGMLEVINQDYIRTARAKGLGENKVILKHALRNGLLPIITVFANIFPLAIGGSVIIETIFSIPGMGLEIYQSILNYDYPMIVAVFTIFGVLTLLGYLVADILYALAAPRISYGKK